MNWKELRALDEQYMMRTYRRLPVDIDRGDGLTLCDLDGWKYLDFAGGAGGNVLGIGNTDWAEAIMEQALKLGHAPHFLYTQPPLLLAEQLCLRTGMASVFFTSSDMEAKFAMAKLARTYSLTHHGSGRSTILTLQDPFPRQGGMPPFSSDTTADPSAFGFCRASLDMDDIQQKTSGDICAVMLELLQDDGSMNSLSRKFVHALAVHCAEHDWLLLLDEGRTGIGRMGMLFAFQQYGIVPDVVSFSGGLGGGLPIGGILANNRCRDLFAPGDVHSPFGENPVCAAAALTVLDLLNENTLAQIKEKGDYLRIGIESLALPQMRDIQGQGLMASLSLSEEYHIPELVSKLSNYGLLCLVEKDKLLLMPPLLIRKDEMDRGLSILKWAFSEGV